MINEILSRQPLSADFETGWFAGKTERIGNYGATASLRSLQLVWNGVSGVMDGAITLYASNMPESGAVGEIFNINCATNEGDSLLIVMLCEFRFFKIKYSGHGITGGEIAAYAAFE